VAEAQAELFNPEKSLIATSLMQERRNQLAREIGPHH
jgi:hypothetical protein